MASYLVLFTDVPILECHLCEANCMTCSSDTVCNVCDANYFLRNSDCKTCSGWYGGACEICNTTHCSNCSHPYSLASPTNNPACINCAITPNCNDCDMHSVCTGCSSGYFLEGIARTFYSNSAATTCALCSFNILNCANCSSATVCVNC